MCYVARGSLEHQAPRASLVIRHSKQSTALAQLDILPIRVHPHAPYDARATIVTVGIERRLRPRQERHEDQMIIHNLAVRIGVQRIGRRFSGYLHRPIIPKMPAV